MHRVTLSIITVLAVARGQYIRNLNEKDPIRNYPGAMLHYVNIGPKLAGDYKFGYDTGKGPLGQSFRQEIRLADGTVTGTYGMVDELGHKRVVHYSAGKTGFRAQENSNVKNEYSRSQPRLDRYYSNIGISRDSSNAKKTLPNSYLKSKATVPGFETFTPKEQYSIRPSPNDLLSRTKNTQISKFVDSSMKPYAALSDANAGNAANLASGYRSAVLYDRDNYQESIPSARLSGSYKSEESSMAYATPLQLKEEDRKITLQQNEAFSEKLRNPQEDTRMSSLELYSPSPYRHSKRLGSHTEPQGKTTVELFGPESSKLSEISDPEDETRMSSLESLSPTPYMHTKRPDSRTLSQKQAHVESFRPKSLKQSEYTESAMATRSKSSPLQQSRFVTQVDKPYRSRFLSTYQNSPKPHTPNRISTPMAFKGKQEQIVSSEESPEMKRLNSEYGSLEDGGSSRVYDPQLDDEYYDSSPAFVDIERLSYNIGSSKDASLGYN